MKHWLVTIGIIKTTPKRIKRWIQEQNISMLLAALPRGRAADRAEMIRALHRLGCQSKDFYRQLIHITKNDFLSVATEAAKVLRRQWHDPDLAAQVSAALRMFEDRLRREHNRLEFAGWIATQNLVARRDRIRVVENVKASLKLPLSWGKISW